jgi:hypothetical protein
VAGFVFALSAGRSGSGPFIAAGDLPSETARKGPAVSLIDS